MARNLPDRNGIRQLLTKLCSPTTTGKVERWHQTRQVEFLNDSGPFSSIEEAQAAVDQWREEYNHRRPHQCLDMATPADRFRPSADAGDGLALWSPPDLEPVVSPAVASETGSAGGQIASWPDAVEIDRVVPAAGNMAVGPQQFWLGTSRTNAGPDTFDVDIRVQLPEQVRADLQRAEELRQEAARSQHEAPVLARSAARRLHGDGLPLRDIGKLLQVSHQRAHQLVDEARQRLAG